MIRLRQYIMGRAIDIPGTGDLIEMVLPDGRTVQLSLTEDGEIRLRGWGNVPALLGNSNSVTLTCKLDYEEPTTCPVCYHRFERCNCNDCEG